MPNKKVTRTPRRYSLSRRPNRRPNDPIAAALNRATDRMVDAVDQLFDQMLDKFLPYVDQQQQQQTQSQQRQQQQEQPRQKPKARAKDYEILTLYAILEVSESASPETIIAAYKSLSKRYHPDNLETGSTEKMKVINGAFDALSDPVKRRVYDQMLRRAR